MRAIIVGLLLATSQPAAATEKPKNIIVMIADGAGYNTLAATRYWKAGPLAVDTGNWRRAALATYALRRGPDVPEGSDPLAQDSDFVYASAKAWDTTPIEGASAIKPQYPALFAGYEWNRKTAPDSANTMSAMMTGVRSYNGAINVDGAMHNVLSLAEAAKAAGKMTGSISSVPFNHATPAAGGGAHNPSREAYHDLAIDMFEGGTLDVIGGGGNPDFDHDGRPLADENAANRFKYIPPALWQSLRLPESKWKLVQDRRDIEALANGDTLADRSLAMIVEVAETLQLRRAPGAGEDTATYAPGGTPMTGNVPELATMARAALNHVGSDPDGFFLQIEGGAVDWAMHANAFGRMIEEYAAFDDAVRAVIAWVDSPDSAATWEDTMLIVTADHDHLLFGPDIAEPFQRVTNNGAGKLPGYSWASNSHSNQLVPFYVRGAGADALITAANDQDVHTDRQGRKFGFGRYLTQTEMGSYLLSVVK